MTMEEFKDYFTSFYGPQGLYPKTFEHGFTDQQFELSYQLRLASGNYAGGDSFDRESVRDIMISSIRPIHF